MNNPGKGIIHDYVPDAKVHLGCMFTGTLFYRYAVENGYYGQAAEDEARKLEGVYDRQGWGGLFEVIQNWVKQASTR